LGFFSAYRLDGGGSPACGGLLFMADFELVVKAKAEQLTTAM
jgi:hypothetical protein